MESFHIKIVRGFSVLLLAGAFLTAAFLTAWAGEYWAADPKTGCQIGWVFEDYSLVTASWSGPEVDGKAEGKGVLTLTVRDKGGKELRGQADAEMKAGKLDGKATIKWSDGRVYGGEWKAGKLLNPQDGNAWLRITYDPGVSPAIRRNAQKAADITVALLARYGLPLSQPVTVIVTADSEGYFDAIASFHQNVTRAAVKKVAGTTLGMSIAKGNAIIVRGHPRQAEYLSEILMILPHEAFHQAMRQYLKNIEPPSWISEGSAEYFRSMALEEGGAGNVDALVKFAEQKIRKAASIPDTHRLVDHKEYNTIKRDFPVYEMSQVMISRLIANMDFGKVVSFYKLLHEGIPTDKAFSDAFGMPMSAFLDEMNVYFKTQLKKVQ